MSIIIPANTLATGGFDVANSLRFEWADAGDLNKTLGTATNRKKFTISTWVKRSDLYTNGASRSNYILAAGTNASTNVDELYFRFDTLDFSGYESSSTVFQLRSDAAYRDISAWYHVVVAFDSTQGTDSNRVKIYINNVQITDWDVETYPSQNLEPLFNKNVQHMIGRVLGGSKYYGGYMSEFVFIDGQQLAPTDFGEFDEDSEIWKPIDVSGLTFGDNGFYLEFKQAGTGTNASGMGADTSGNTDHFAVNNLTAVAQSTDTCTNNFATINSLDNYYNSATLSEGNLKVTTANSGGYAPTVSTFGLNSGKWYAEVKYVSRSASDNYSMIGVRSTQTTNTNYLGQNTNDYAYYSGNGKTYSGGSASSYGNSYDQGNVIGIYLDLDNNKLYFSKDGTLQNSGTGVSITAPASTSLGNYFFGAMDYGNSVFNVYEWNFGSPPYAISSSNSDPNGYGSFEYSTTITGDSASKAFYAINSKNLAEYG